MFVYILVYICMYTYLYICLDTSGLRQRIKMEFWHYVFQVSFINERLLKSNFLSYFIIKYFIIKY